MGAGPRVSSGEVARESAADAVPVFRRLRARLLDRDAALGIAAVALTASWIGYFLFTNMPQLTLHVFPSTITLHSLVGGLALAYLAALAVQRRLPGGTPLDLPVLAVIGAYALATYTSVNWRLSLEALLQLSAAVITLYALSGLPLLNARQLVRALVLAGIAVSLYALWVVGNDYADYLSITRDVQGLDRTNIFPPTVPRVHDVSDPNGLAMLITLIAPFVVLAALAAKSRWERALAMLALPVMAMALFLTLQRGAWAGAAGAGVLVVVGAWLTRRIIEQQRSGGRVSWQTVVPAGLTPTALMAMAGTLALAIAGTVAFLARSSTRPGWLFRDSLSPRRDAWRAGWEIFRDHPLTGAGPDTFGVLYPEYARGNFLVQTQHAHNTFLQVADAAGILGLLAVLILGAVVLYMIGRVWLVGTLEQRLLAVACVASLAGFLFYNMLGSGYVWKAPAITLAVIGAIAVRNYAEATPERAPFVRLPALTPRFSRGAQVFAGGALVVVIVLSLAGWFRVDSAHHDYWRGAEKLNKGEPGAIEALQAAVDADSSMMPYQLLLGQAQATTFDATGRRDRSLIDRAIVHLERAIDLDKRSGLAQANLARAYEMAARDDEAAEAARRTRVIARFHVTPVLAAGEVFEDLEMERDAVETYGQVLSMDAGLANSTFWQGSAFRREHFEEILQASALGINPCTYGAFLVEARRFTVGDPAESLDEVQRGCEFLLFTGFANDLVLRTNLAKILAQRGEREDALGHLRFAVDRQPDFGPARTELGRWYAGEGNIDEARHQWLLGAELGELESARLLGDSYGDGDVPQDVIDRAEELLGTSGSSVQNDVISVLYYRLRYGRLSPVSSLIPGDWQTAVPRPYAEARAALDRWRGN